MSTHPLPSGPPLAGLCTHEAAASPGMPVDTTVERLRRYVYLETQVVRMIAADFNRLPEWEVKGALSLHLWQDAEHNTWFRKRIPEMRTPPHHLDKVPDPALEAFVAELRRAETTAEFLVGVYGVLKPAMATAWRDHLRESHPIADHPTRRLLRMALTEEEEQIEWGTAAIAAQHRDNGEQVDAAALAAWSDHLRAYLAAAGGINGGDTRTDAAALPPSRVTGPVETSHVPARDRRFTRVWESRGQVPDATRPIHERLWWMMNVRLNEMHVSELIATVMADWTDQPWAFYHDLARHLWDETRHCMLGEVAFVSQGVDFTKLPTHIGFAAYPNQALPAPERYAFLWGIEQGLMTKTGKQAEVGLARASGDERATVFQDFDWADEVLHAAIGRRWLEPHFQTREAMLDVYARIRPAYDEMKEADLKLPGRDWWPEFYAQHLAPLDPELGQANEWGGVS
ncbi:hypothetical protein [Synoicihabitans lomoniglobus]|uniref:DUF455 family protein n=1 Tax=Synoicihabitans lomoniglobus TaxID=2909285 RepID=A0AAF0A0J8_9BACT|nr:hypothetical protein [Opitutaceae bacterium LMO-M01]WED65053.1 hypothetical protein PXH66_22110 [Opitutaceae bacterium LMO-M01]